MMVSSLCLLEGHFGHLGSSSEHSVCTVSVELHDSVDNLIIDFPDRARSNFMREWLLG